MNETLKDIAVACAKETNLEGLKRTFTSFKYKIDRLNDADRDKSREIYWENKRRINNEN